jgi:alginate O-acetyltransferase complex protein AlgI
MLFNSFDFIFLFLPVTLAAFAAAVRLRSSSVAVLVLLVASYVFYGYGDHFAILLLAGSTAFNYVIGQAVAWAMRRGEGTLGRLLLGIGICGDLALLGYFKYAGFLMTNLDQLAGAQWPIPVIALPIGISFYTFTQIAFLVDTFRGAAATLRATDYFLFVAYFPHLVLPDRSSIMRKPPRNSGAWGAILGARATLPSAFPFSRSAFSRSSGLPIRSPFADAAFTTRRPDPLQ